LEKLLLKELEKQLIILQNPYRYFLSIHLNVESNETLALVWLCLRLVFVSLYVSGIGTKPANEKGYEAQPLRSIVWIISIGYLVKMAINLT
jgi:uncharacterized MAPEG superfamily protein